MPVWRCYGGEAIAKACLLSWLLKVDSVVYFFFYKFGDGILEAVALNKDIGR